MHGAPIQCTRGKCSKAFHISCAREGAEHGIVYEEVGEVEKDVVFVDVAAMSSLYVPMELDANVSPPQETPSDSVDAKASNKEAIKVVKKIEFQLLCPQHNPVSVTQPNPGVSSLIARLGSSCKKSKRRTNRIRFGKTCSPLRRCQGSRSASVPAYLRFPSSG